ncbi:MAG: serine O-acetyltransferase [Candidatus Obscuribacterales bacterium]|nr:serine O-acetyltransferase [Candidatus Obscuribacterales bacterium]
MGSLRMGLGEDIKNILDKDPAARSPLEVLLCYPGLHAIQIYRIANRFYRLRMFTMARFLSHIGRMLTGIEIHPGATIGKRVLIDHGMGVVVGETAEVGDDCVLYQGVTLGAGAEARGGSSTRGVKRHPTLGRGVVVGSGAEIQGAITVGDNVRVASGSIVLRDVPPDSIVVGVPGRVIYREGKKVEDGKVPDIEAEALKSMKRRIDELERRLEAGLPLVGAAAEKKSDFRSSLDTDPDTNSSGSEGEDPVEVFLHGAGI